MNTIKSQNEIEEIGHFYKQISKINKEYMDYWIENTLWHWDFWLSLCLTIVPWVIWFLVRKKDSQIRLLLAGLIMLVISSWLDFIGVVLGLWFYTADIVPTIPSYLPWDFTILPVITMLFIQFKPKANPWIKAALFSSFNSFLGEPLMQWLGLYVPLKWSIFYSLPIYILIFLICYRIAQMSGCRAIK